MKKSILLILCAVATLSVAAQRGEKTVGIMAGYNTENHSGLAGLYFQYRCGQLLRLSPDCQFAIKNDNVSAFMFNGNAHFLIRTSDSTNFYPLVGITYHNWKFHTAGPSDNVGRFGGNVGAGFEARLSPTLKVAVEGKYSLLKDFSSGYFYASIGYVF